MSRIFLFTSFFKLILIQLISVRNATDMSNRIPTKCETCKFFTIEFNKVLKKLDNEGLVEKNFDYDRVERSSKQFKESELILMEALHMACRNLLDYHVHPKKPGRSRFADDVHPGMKGYTRVRRGDKVNIEPDDDSWDVAPLEIMNLKKACDNMVDLYEEDIEDWYHNERSRIPIRKYLCEGIVLKKEDRTCLSEIDSIYKKEEL